VSDVLRIDPVARLSCPRPHFLVGVTSISGSSSRSKSIPGSGRTPWPITSVEVCGVLVGRWGKDADGPFVTVSASIPGNAAESKFAEVTFTHETWAKINEEMDRNHPDLIIVGWSHTHPDFGVFLSDHDVFIQQHFFSEAGHIAHVINPIRLASGVAGSQFLQGRLRGVEVAGDRGQDWEIVGFEEPEPRVYRRPDLEVELTGFFE
jgi:proteasome lid subunit RPN8/RPN11